MYTLLIDAMFSANVFRANVIVNYSWSAKRADFGFSTEIPHVCHGYTAILSSNPTLISGGRATMLLRYQVVKYLMEVMSSHMVLQVVHDSIHC